MPRLTGSDVPNQTSALKNPFGVQPIAGTDVSQGGINIAQNAISNVAQQLQKSNQQQAATSQAIAQASNQAQESMANSEVTSMKASVDSGKSAAKIFEGLTKTAGGVLKTINDIEERNTKAKEAYEKKQQDAAFAEAQIASSKLQTDAQERMRNGIGGRTALERDFETLVANPNLTPDAKAKLYTDFYGTLSGLQAENSKRTRESFDKLQDQKLEERIERLRIGMSPALAELAQAPDDETQGVAMARLNSFIQQAVEDNNLSVSDKQRLITDAMTQVRTRAWSSDEAQAKTTQMLGNWSEFTNQAALLAADYKETGDTAKFTAELALLAERLGVPSSIVAAYDPDKLREKVNSVEQAQQQTYELKKNRELITFEGKDFSDLEVGRQAYQLANDPAGYARFKEKYGKSSTGAAILALADSALKLRKEENDLREYNATIGLAKQQILADDIQGLIGLIKSSKPDKPNPLLSIPSISASITAEMAAVLQAGQTDSPEYKAALDEAYARLSAKRGDIINGLDAQLEAKDAAVSSTRRLLERYGWRDGTYDQGLYEMAAKKTKEQAEALRIRQQAEQESGQTPSFRMPSLKAVKSRDGRTAYLPLPVNAQATQLQNYGQDRGDHVHAGEDIAIPVGTPIIAALDGQVTRVSEDPNGYGLFAEVKYSDGTFHLFGHLSKQMVREGQKIRAGTVVAKSGNTGRSTGPHLHWEVRTAGTEQVIDPYTWGTNYKPGAARQARSGDTGRMRPGVVPKDAIPMTGGFLLMDKTSGKVKFVRNDGSISGAPNYSVGAPMRASSNSTNIKDYPKKNNPNANYGYATFAKDKAFAREVARVSDRLGFPAQWLADVMAFETGGTFDPAVQNQGGAPAHGLIQFYDDADRPGGKTIGGRWYSKAEIKGMSRVQQMKLVEKYLEPFKGQIREPKHLLGAIFGGTVNLSTSSGDGDIQFGQYLSRLGEHAGRKYYGPNGQSNRQARAMSKTDRTFNASCAMCSQQMASLGKIIPHERVG